MKGKWKYFIFIFVFLFFSSSCNNNSSISLEEKEEEIIEKEDKNEFEGPKNVDVSINYQTSTKETQYFLSYDKVADAISYRITIGTKSFTNKATNFSITSYFTNTKPSNISVEACKQNSGVLTYSAKTTIEFEPLKVNSGMIFELKEDNTYIVDCFRCTPSQITGKVVFPDTVNLKNLSELKTFCLSRPFDSMDKNGNMLSGKVSQNDKTTSVRLPKNLEIIGFGAFDSNVELESIELPKTLKQISSSAFSDCQKITKVIVPEGVTIVEDGAFSGCESLVDITLPSTLSSLDGTFSGCKSLEKIYLPETITTLSDGVFYDCTSLKEINLKNVTELGDKVFYNCTSLEEIKLYNITKLGNNLFNGCTSLKNINLENITTFGDFCLYNTKLVNEHEGFLVINNILIAYNGDAIELKANMFPKGISYIVPGAFNNSINLTSIELPEGITLLPTSLFGDGGYDINKITLNNLVSLVLPRTLTTIECMAFTGTSISYLFLPKNVTNFGINKSGFSSFSNSNIEKIEIEEGTTEIYPNEFRQCSRITEVVLPSTITKIGSYAFSYCTNLSNIILVDSIKIIESNAFGGCTSIEIITLPKSLEYIETAAFSCCTSLVEVKMQDNVTKIGAYAFDSCRNLIDINMSKSLKIIENHAFTNCTKLINIEFYDSGIEIKECSFRFSGIKKVIIPESLKLYNDAFVNCSQLEEITLLGDNLYDIRVFLGCNKLSKVILGDKITKIPDYSFDSCFSLTSITIPSSVKYIGKNAFYSIKELIIPRSVTSFFSQDKLETIYYLGSEKDLSESDLFTCNDFMKLNIYFYSETEPLNEGKYWHYDITLNYAIKW